MKAPGDGLVVGRCVHRRQIRVVNGWDGIDPAGLLLLEVTGLEKKMQGVGSGTQALERAPAPANNLVHMPLRLFCR